MEGDKGHRIISYWALATNDSALTREKRAGNPGINVWDVNYVLPQKNDALIVVWPFVLRADNTWQEGVPFVAANVTREERDYAEKHWAEILERLWEERPGK